MMWTNKEDTSKNTQLTNAINGMQHGQLIKPKEEAPNKLAKLSKSCEQTKQLNTKGKRKRDQRGFNKPPAVPISHSTHHNNAHQNGPNSGSEGEECPKMEHKRSKVGPVPKK
eukprot:11548368-Ditylum_brightwellii.AAC.1